MLTIAAGNGKVNLKARQYSRQAFNFWVEALLCSRLDYLQMKMPNKYKRTTLSFVSEIDLELEFSPIVVMYYCSAFCTLASAHSYSIYILLGPTIYFSSVQHVVYMCRKDSQVHPS